MSPTCHSPRNYSRKHYDHNTNVETSILELDPGGPPQQSRMKDKHKNDEMKRIIEQFSPITAENILAFLHIMAYKYIGLARPSAPPNDDDDEA